VASCISLAGVCIVDRSSMRVGVCVECVCVVECVCTYVQILCLVLKVKSSKKTTIFIASCIVIRDLS